MDAECKMMNAECAARRQTECRTMNAAGIPHSSFLIPGSRPRRAISLLEILVSLGILSVGLVGVAVLIPVGKLAMSDVNKSDRTGACGRAAIHEIKIRRMLDTTINTTAPPSTNLVDPLLSGQNPPTVPANNPAWPGARLNWGGPFAIDPVGVLNGLSYPNGGLGMNLGGTRALPQNPPTFSDYFPLPRFALNWAWATPALGDRIFRWSDELKFNVPQGATKRPRAEMTKDSSGNSAPYPPLPSETAFTPVTLANDGQFSWFATVNPLGNNNYSVSVVVCHSREFSTTTPGMTLTNLPTAERTVDIVNMFGGTVQLPTTTSDVTGTNNSLVLNSTTFPLKKDQWVMLLGWETATGQRIPRECKWYRVVGIGTDVTTTPYVSLDGPTWDWPRFSNQTMAPNYSGTTMVVVDGATGVYTTTVQLD